MNKLKSGIILMSLVSVILIVSGCSSGEDSESSADGGSNGMEGEITIASWAAAADAMEDAAEAFMEEHPEANITIQQVSANYEAITPPLTAGSGAPDIIHTEQRDFQTFLERFGNQFLDITDMMAEKEEEFAEVAWTAVEKDEKIWGVPWDLGPVGVWYRIDYFEEAGIDPESINTWDDYIDAGKQLQNELSDVAMVTYDISGTAINPSNWMMLMNQLGGTFTNEAGEINFANEANVQAMEMVKRKADEGIVLNTSSWDEFMRAIVSGETATVIHPVWLAGSIQANAPDLAGKWGVMPLPAFEEGGPNQANLGGGVLAITTQSEHPELAKAFLEYALLTEEGQTIQMEYGLFPSWQPFYETDSFNTDDNDYFDFNLAETFAALSADIPELEFDANYSDYHQAIMEGYGRIFNEDLDPAEALEYAEERAASATGSTIADN